MRYQGKITDWKDDQGFGFITPNGGGKQVFVHIKSFARKHRRPADLELVTYELASDSRGRIHAENVMLVGERQSSQAVSDNNIVFYIVTAFFILILVSFELGKLDVAVFGTYVIASAIAYCAYALDKSAAKKDQWRIKESTLHFFALVGGWPGALLAQKILRHKSKKQSFRTIFWITVILNCCVLYWLFTLTGSNR
jgi:uncharacterized membrane protein YsdA (DUF1294 family)/cold shock CspA family protein